MNTLNESRYVKEIEELKALAKPLVELLRNKYNPHCAVVITSDYIKVVSDKLSIPLSDFII